jgi:hypothetical protein
MAIMPFIKILFLRENFIGKDPMHRGEYLFRAYPY